VQSVHVGRSDHCVTRNGAFKYGPFIRAVAAFCGVLAIASSTKKLKGNTEKRHNSGQRQTFSATALRQQI